MDTSLSEILVQKKKFQAKSWYVGLSVSTSQPSNGKIHFYQQKSNGADKFCS